MEIADSLFRHRGSEKIMPPISASGKFVVMDLQGDKVSGGTRPGIFLAMRLKSALLIERPKLSTGIALGNACLHTTLVICRFVNPLGF